MARLEIVRPLGRDCYLVESDECSPTTASDPSSQPVAVDRVSSPRIGFALALMCAFDVALLSGVLMLGSWLNGDLTVTAVSAGVFVVSALSVVYEVWAVRQEHQ